MIWDPSVIDVVRSFEPVLFLKPLFCYLVYWFEVENSHHSQPAKKKGRITWG